MASRRITRTKSFSAYLSSINDEVSVLKSRADVTGLGLTSGSVSGDSLADEVSLESNGIHSSNYIPNYSGWRIGGSGVAEFSDVFVRGDINAYSGTIGYWNISSPFVSRTFGDTTLYGTFLESSAIGDSDVNKTDGTYVGLFKSYELESNLILSKYRKDNIATITTPGHAFVVGDKVYVSVTGDSSFSAIASPVSIIETTADTISYINEGLDFTNLDASDNPVDNTAAGTVTLYNPDVAGLYLRDYSKSEFDYGYFSNQGVSYVSAEDINVIENPGFEYGGSYSAVSWVAGTGLTLVDSDLSTVKSSSAHGGGLSWGSPAVSTYLTGNIDYAAGNAYKVFGLGRDLYLGLTVFPNYDVDATKKTISSIGTYNLTGNFATATANTTTITYTGTGLNFSSGQYLTVSGFSNSRFNITNQKITTATSTVVTVDLAGATVSTETTTRTASVGLLKVVVPTGSTFAAGDIAFLDVDAGVYNTTYGEITKYYSPHTIADGSRGHTYVVSSYPVANTTTFYLQTEYGVVDTTGTVLTPQSHYNVDGTARDAYVYKAYEAALDLSAITFTYSTGSVSTSIIDVLSTLTAAQWSSDSKTKYLLSTANDYMLGKLDASVKVPAMVKSISIVLDGASIDAAYLAADPTGYATAANIKINIPGWLVKHDGAGVVPSSPTKIASIGYVIDNVYLSTAPNFFYGDSGLTYNWYSTTDGTDITDASQASIEGTKTWIDVNLRDQSAHINYFDYVGFKNNKFDNQMYALPSLGVVDSTPTLVKFPDATYETTTLTGGTYQYGVSGGSYDITIPSLKLLTGYRSSAFELSSQSRSYSSSDNLETLRNGAVIYGVYDQNDSGSSTIYTGSNKFVWTSYPNYLDNESLASVIFTPSLATFRQKVLGLEGFTGSTLRLTTTSGISLSSTAHALQIGDSASVNLRLDSNEIQTVNNAAASTLYINRSGGTVTVANTSATTTILGPVRLSKTNAYSLGATDHAFQIGASNDVNVRMDTNGIQAVNNGSTSTLNINTFGGNVDIGNTTSVTSALGSFEVGGGYATSGVTISSTGLVSTNSNIVVDGNGTFGNLTGVGTRNVNSTSAGILTNSTSSARYKQDIVDAEYVYEDILKLQPKTFKLKSEVEELDNPVTYGGFIAEDVHEIDSLRVFVGYAKTSDETLIPDSLYYAEMVSALVSAIKYQDVLISSLKTRLDALESK